MCPTSGRVGRLADRQAGRDRLFLCPVQFLAGGLAFLQARSRGGWGWGAQSAAVLVDCSSLQL